MSSSSIDHNSRSETQDQESLGSLKVQRSAVPDLSTVDAQTVQVQKQLSKITLRDHVAKLQSASAPELGRPQTPTGGKPPIFTTPSSRGSASAAQSDGHRDLKPEHVGRYFAMDIVRRRDTDFLNILKYFLRKTARNPLVNSDDLLNECLAVAADICNDSKKVLDKFFDQYRGTVVEVERYAPLVFLLNHLLEQLKGKRLKFTKLHALSSLDFLYHRNDPKQLVQCHGSLFSTRSVDVGAVSKASAERVAKKTIQPEKTPDKPFGWGDILHGIELKVDDTPSAPPTSYTLSPATFLPAAKSIAACPKPYLEAEQKEKGTKQTQSRESTKSVSLRRSARLASASNSTKNSDNVLDTSSSTSSSSLSSLSEDDPNNAVDAEEDKIFIRVMGMHRPPPLVQVALYAGEMLSRGPFALHAINMLIVDDVLWLWWYDRQNIMQSTGLNFFQNLPYLVCLLAAFQRFELRNWGIEPRLIYNQGIFNDEGGHEQHLNDFEFRFRHGPKVTIFPRKPIFSRLSLRGRATRVLEATCESIFQGIDYKGKDLVLKIASPEKSRRNEAELITIAVEKLKEIGRDDLVKHLPTLICTEDLDYSTGDINDACTIIPDPTRGPRGLRLLLFRRLSSIDTLKDPVDFFRAWLQCFICHFHLWTTGVEHGDISLWNLMWDPEKKIGVLNDFDLISIRNVVQDGTPIELPHGERTGTIPFMALDLLRKEYFQGKIKRLYRHDAESFMWVFIWVCIRGKRTEVDAELDIWKSGDYKESRRSRLAFLAPMGHSSVKSRRKFNNHWQLCKLFLHWIKENDGIKQEPNPIEVHEKILNMMRTYFSDHVNAVLSPPS